MKRLFIRLIIASFILLPSTAAFAIPQGGAVAAGNVTISSPNANTMQINQTTDKAIINWQSYNIGAQQHVNYQQPNSSSISLNRINPTNGASQIYGQLTANGQVWLINPAGIYFGPTAYVNVGGLLATTANISDHDFLSGNYVFKQSPQWNGAVINDGVIKTTQAGLVALVGSGVVNNGHIEANLGTVVLASGSEFTLNFSGNDLISFTVDKELLRSAQDQNGQPIKDGVRNTGKISANGGKVLVTARAASHVLDHVINMEGVVEAKSVGMKNGEIVLLGEGQGIVKVSGKMIASGRRSGEKGGRVRILGNKVALTEHAEIDVTGDIGGGEVLIGGDYQGKNVNIKNAERTFVGSDATVFADALTNGDGGKVIVWADGDTSYFGTILARGGIEQGHGGFIEVSGKNGLDFNGYVDTRSTNGKIGTLLLDPKFLIVATTSGSAYNNGVNNLFANNTSGTNIITPASIVAAATNIVLQANSDIIFTNTLAMTTVGATLTVQAGRSILVNANISTNNAAISMTANSASANSADRSTTNTGNPSGDFESVLGNITMAAGTSINSGTGSLTLTIDPTSSGNFTPGNLTLIGLTGGAISLSTPNAITAGAIAQSSSLTVDVGTTSVLSGVISGAGNFVKNGVGRLVLAAGNTYTGTSTLNNGIVSISLDNGLGLNPGVATPGKLVFNGGTLQTTATFTLTTNRGITLNAGGGTFSPDAGFTLTYGGVATGIGNFIKSGSGNLSLGGVSTYTGGTIINAGTLLLTASNRLPTLTALTINSPGIFNTNNNTQTIGSLAGNGTLQNTGGGGAEVLTVGGNNTSTIFSGLIGTGGTRLALTKTGSGSLTLSGANTYTGATIVSAGTLVAAHATALGTVGTGTTISSGATLDISNALIGNEALTLGVGGAATLTGSGSASLSGPIALSTTSTIGGTGNLSLSGIISGSGLGFIKTGTGTLTLSGVNSYTGTTTINNGIVSIMNASGLGTTAGATLVNSGGTLDFNAVAIGAEILTLNGSGFGGIGALTGTGTSSLVGGITLGSNATIGGTGGLSLTGIITDGASSFNLTKEGTGTLNLSGINTYDGSTTLNNGVLQINADSRLGNVPGVATPGDLIFNGGTLAATGTFTLNSNRGILLNSSGGTVQVNPGFTLTYNGIGAGTGALTKTGSGTLLIGGLNTYSGATNINEGSVQLGVTNAIGASSSVILANVGSANLNLNNFSDTIGSLAGGGTTGGNVLLGSGRLTLGGDNTSTIYSGVISGTNGITKTGTGTFTLAHVASTYTGQTIINNGTLVATKVALGGVNSSIGAAISTLPILVGSATSATLAYSGGTDTTNRQISINGAGGGTIQTTALGTLTLSGSINNNGNPLNFQTNSGDINVSGAVSGSGALTKFGIGTLFLSGTTNTYSGATTVTGGVLSLNHINALGNTSGTTVASSAAVLDINFSNATLANTNTITLNGTGAGANGALTFSGTNITINNPISLAGTIQVLIGGNGTGTMTLNGLISGARNLFINLPNAGISLPAINLTSNNLSVISNGAITQTGILTIPGTASFSSGSNPITLLQNNMLSGAVSLTNNGANDASLNNNTNLTLGTSTVGRKLTAITSGALTLNGSLTAGGTGDSIILSAASFNNSGAFSLNTGAGRFLVWSSNASPFSGGTPDNRGGIAYSFKQYNASYGATTVLGSGNGFLYTLAPSITPSLTGIISKTYDATTTANMVGHYASSGSVDSDVVTLNNPAIGAYNNKNVGTSKNVAVSGIAITSATNGAATVYGYQLSSSTANANIGTITPASLTISSNAGQAKIYGTNDPAGASSAYSVTSGVLYGSDALTGSLGRVSGESVGNYNFTQNTVGVSDGNSGNNYALTFNGSTNPFQINKANLTATIANQNKVYGANDPTLSGIGVTLNGVVNNSVTDINGIITVINDNGNVATSLASLTRAAGETVSGSPYGITGATFNTLSGSAASNYNAPNLVGASTLTISRANLTGSIANQSKVYGANDPTLSGIGVTLNGLINRTVTTWNGSIALNDSSSVATSLVSLTRAAGEAVSGSPYSITTATFNALTGSAAGNYNAPILSAGSTLTVTPASLTGSIANQKKVYGANDPTLSGIGVTLTGLINRSVSTWNGSVVVNDSSNVATSLSSLTRTAGEVVSGSPYAITTASFNALTGSAAGNYGAPSFIGSPTLTVTRTNLTGSIANQTKVYGANDPTLSGIGITLNGLINRTVTTWNGAVSVNDSSNVATTLASLTRNAGEVLSGSPYAITAASFNALTGSAASNYNAPSFIGSPTLTVTPASLTGSIANQTKVYGANDPTLSGIGVTLNGLINRTVTTWNGSVALNDSSAVATSLTTLTRVAGEVVSGSPYAITAASFNALTGSAASNYNAPSFIGSPTLTVTPASLTGSIANQTKVYGANDPTLSGIGVTLNGLINRSVSTWNGSVVVNDSSNVATSLATLNRVAGEVVSGSPYSITSATFNTLSGSAAGNYSAPTFTGSPTLTVTPASLTGSIANQTKVYGANDPTLSGIGVTLNGLINRTVTTWNGSVVL
ncbi:MAG: autotransporter-associated beta strand repeat-containing protein, partial [Gammaproteobacteria bacterium]|nr:autotransporter-associated beta strand repeat-containing protein [Gammaproteobacteria bacterium]